MVPAASVEQDGFASILRMILASTDLGAEFLAIADRMKHLQGRSSS
ncbi:hypothetical protein [Streptomyces sp. NPDC020951]